MDYPRYKPLLPRPFGVGAFFDYATAMTRLYAANLESYRASLVRSGPAPAPKPEEKAQQRWDAEGGNTQARTARRAFRVL